MSKQRARTAAHQRKQPHGSKAPPRPAKPPAIATRTYATVAAVAFIAFGLLVGWTGAWPLVVAPLFTGVFVALCLRRPLASAAVAGSAGLIAAGSAALAYSMPGLAERALAAPPDTNVDIPRLLYDIVGNMVARNPLNSLVQPAGVLLLLASGLAGTAAAAWVTATLLERYRQDAARVRLYVSGGLVALLCMTFVATVIGASGEMIAYANTEPVAGQYAFDATVYLKTYYNMLHGEGYYRALVDAAAGDARVIADKTTGIRDGKSYGGWLWGPAAMRRPTIFYVWRYLAPGGGGNVIYLAAVFGALGLAVSWWGLAPYLSYRAAFVPAFVMPYLLFMTLGLNVFFPDFWAAVLVLCALALVMRRQWVASAAVFLAASAVRETLGPALAVIALLLAGVWLREGRGRAWLARAGSFAGATAVWLGFERLHEALGAPFMAVPYPSALQVLENTMATRTFAEKVTRATQYLIFPYGFYSVPGLVMALLAPAAFWTVLASRKDVRLVVVGYMLFWIAFLFVVGATSSYWGQVIMLPSLAGIGSLIVGADRLDRRMEMTGPPD